MKALRHARHPFENSCSRMTQTRPCSPAGRLGVDDGDRPAQRAGEAPRVAGVHDHDAGVARVLRDEASRVPGHGRVGGRRGAVVVGEAVARPEVDEVHVPGPGVRLGVRDLGPRIVVREQVAVDVGPDLLQVAADHGGAGGHRDHRQREPYPLQVPPGQPAEAMDERGDGDRHQHGGHDQPER
jgi:hypothetical protein